MRLSEVRAMRRATIGRTLAAWLVAAGIAAGSQAAGSGRAPHPVADSATLYNAGIDALVGGDTGAAIVFFKAAQRLEPRAGDIRAGLVVARGRVAAEGSTGARVAAGGPAVPLLSRREVWWCAAILMALGSIAGAFRRIAPGRRAAPEIALLALGIALAVLGGSWAVEEARHPEAVVVVPWLAVEAAAEEQPREAYMLRAGEEVRIGRRRGERTEIWMGGSCIGWASASGLWRVGDAARYTSRSVLESVSGRLGST